MENYNFKIPYRINWTGAYLDCIGKKVITSVIDKYLYFETQSEDIRLLTVESEEKGKVFAAEVTSNYELITKDWTAYVLGCINVFHENNYPLTKGCKVIVKGDLPSGIGLGSSASFIIGIIKTIAYYNGIKLSDSKLVEYAYWVENTYLDIPCGLMDFKAVLHDKGIWEIDTSSTYLNTDVKISSLACFGFITYGAKHNHLSNEVFNINAAKIINYKEIEDEKVLNYIKTEERINQDLIGFQNLLDYNSLGLFLNRSNNNLKMYINNITKSSHKLHGVYGEKVMGSGLKGSSLILIHPSFMEQIEKELLKEKRNVIRCKI